MADLKENMADLKNDEAVKQLIKEAVRQTKKRILLTELCIVMIIAGIFTYCIYNPKVTLYLNKQSSNGDYVNLPFLMIETPFNLGIPQWLVDKEHIFIDGNNAVINDIYANYQPPWQVDCSAEFRDGKTIITYEGPVTDKQSVQQHYYRQAVFDFILTEHVEQ